jgi:hypothetical protein
MKIRFVSDCLLENVDDIKVASLYFDEIEILKRMHVEDIEFLESEQALRIKAYPLFSQDFTEHLTPFQEEGIVTYSLSTRVKSAEIDRSDVIDFNAQAKSIIRRNVTSIFPEVSVQIEPGSDHTFMIELPDDMELQANAEAEVVYDNHLSKINKLKDFGSGNATKVYYLIHYYTFLFEELLASLYRGETCLTASPTLHALLRSHYQSDAFRTMSQLLKQQRDINPSIAFEALRLAVPDVSRFPIEEILELRELAKDELCQFRDYINRLTLEIEDGYDHVQAIVPAGDIVNAKIKPALDDLTNKIVSLNYRIPRRFLEEIKDPKSYAPLLGTFLAQVPAHIAIVLSLGLVGASIALEYLETMQEIKRHGLYYLIKLRKELS